MQHAVGRFGINSNKNAIFDHHGRPQSDDTRGMNQGNIVGRFNESIGNTGG